MIVAALATVGVGGCSSGGDNSPTDASNSNDASSGNVSGAWCGLPVGTAAECVGDEVVYAEFAQAGIAVTGTACEYYRAGCYPLENGMLVGGHLTYRYTFTPDHVDADFTLATDGQSLTGAYTSTKCGCQIALTLHLLP